MFDELERLGAGRCFLWSHRPSGLRAVLVIDDVTLGPAAGGVRTRAYPSLAAAVDDAARLARAMTLKCALAGLDAGGAKAVVLDHPGLDRPAAFARLGRFVDELGGLFRTAGDLGTTRADLAAMAAHTRFVHTDERGLADAVGRGVVRCVEACVGVRGRAGLDGLRVAVQGCGAIGAAVARRLAAAGASLVVADVDADRARELAAELGAAVVDPDLVLLHEVDVVAPCAIGGVVTTEVVSGLRAWAVCGAANNILGDASVGDMLAARGILYVPDVIASAGAVVDGIGASVMGLADRGPLIDRLGDTAGEVLRECLSSGVSADAVAERRARERLAAAAG